MTIWKFPFPISEEFELEIPEDAYILHADLQDSQPCLWALLDPANPPETRTFSLVGTGHTINHEDIAHTSTFQMGPFVWHLFEYWDEAS